MDRKLRPFFTMC